jgi:hypothetical protein
VHKSVENARFSPRKVQKRGFFAGGRGDFLAGQKRGFLGSAGVRGVTRGGADFEPSSNSKIELKHLRFILLVNKKNNFIFLFTPFTKKE